MIEPNAEIRYALIEKILIERVEQDKKHGGPGHDNQHSPDDWGAILLRHTGLAMNDTVGKPFSEVYERQMIRVAATALAALEAFERKRRREDRFKQLLKNGPEICECGKPSNHTISQYGYTWSRCCRCHVLIDGCAPTDWHDECVQAYQERQKKEKIRADDPQTIVIREGNEGRDPRLMEEKAQRAAIWNNFHRIWGIAKSSPEYQKEEFLEMEKELMKLAGSNVVGK